MATLRLWGIGSALALGFALVLGGPTWLIREWMRAPAWDPQTVVARFEFLRADRDTLVFAYQVQNNGGRKARLTPAVKLHALQPQGQPLLGYPVIRLPLDLAPHSSQRVEVRMELANQWDVSEDPPSTLNETRRVLSRPPLSRTSPELRVEETLRDLEGFELVDGASGMRLLFPRGW